MHVQLTSRAHRTYRAKVEGVISKCEKRLTWLKKGSRQLFGTLLESRVVVVIDTSSSVKERLGLIKEKVKELLQVHSHHTTNHTLFVCCFVLFVFCFVYFLFCLFILFYLLFCFVCCFVLFVLFCLFILFYLLFCFVFCFVCCFVLFFVLFVLFCFVFCFVCCFVLFFVLGVFCFVCCFILFVVLFCFLFCFVFCFVCCFLLFHYFFKSQEQLSFKKEFTLIHFNSEVHPWRSSLVPTSPQNLDAVGQWVEGLLAEGSTNTLGALEVAMSVREVEAVYLLTDGRPDQPLEEILKRVQQLPSIPVHTISFNCADSKANFFLSQLAMNTGGR